MVVFVRLWNAINSFRFRAIFIGQQMALRTDYSGEYLLGGAGWHIVFVKKLGNRTAGVGGGKQAGAGIHCYGNDTGRAAEALSGRLALAPPITYFQINAGYLPP